MRRACGATRSISGGSRCNRGARWCATSRAPAGTGRFFRRCCGCGSRLTGESAYAMRYFSLLWGVVCVALIYALAKRLLDGRVAAWSALLLALSPYMVWYAQEIKMYTWVPMLVLLALYALDRACRPRTHLRGGWKGGVVARGAGGDESGVLQPHPRGAADSGGGGVVRAASASPSSGLARWVGRAGAADVPYLPLLGWQVELLSQTRETGYPDYTLWQMVLVLFSGWTVGVYRGSAFAESVDDVHCGFPGCGGVVGSGWLVFATSLADTAGVGGMDGLPAWRFGWCRCADRSSRTAI